MDVISAFSGINTGGTSHGLRASRPEKSREKMDQPQDLAQGICKTLLNSELDAFIVIDGDSRIVFWNAAAETMFGYTREHALDKTIHELITPENNQQRAKDAFAHYRATGSGTLINNIVEIEALHRSGRLFPVEVSLSATQIDGVWFAQAIVRNIDRRKEVEAEMKRLTTMDALTGIYNRKSMFDHGKRELSRAIRYGNSLSLIILDIDKLKEINDNHGQFAGDQVIQALANFLLEHCRTSDIVGRLSSEEMLLLLPETEVSMAAMVAEKWRDGIAQLRVNVGDKDIKFRCSIGVSSLENEDNFEIVLNKAGNSLGDAKDLGGDTVVCRGTH